MRRSRPSPRQLRIGEAAAWGPRSDDARAAAADRPPTRPRLRLLGWRAIRKGGLVGFAEIELPIGLQIFGVAIMRGSSGLWASLPQRAELDRERRQKIGSDGKPSYGRVAQWRDRDLSDRFSGAVLDLVRSAHPGDLDDDEGAP
jgi:hypothetical protein